MLTYLEENQQKLSCC